MFCLWTALQGRQLKYFLGIYGSTDFAPTEILEHQDCKQALWCCILWFHANCLCVVFGVPQRYSKTFLIKLCSIRIVVNFYKLFWRIQIVETEIAESAIQFCFLQSLIFCYWYLELIPLLWSSTSCYRNTWIHIQCGTMLSVLSLCCQVGGISLAVGCRP